MTMGPSGETAHIISQIATLDNKILELNEERATLLQKLNYIQSPVISRIPIEVLSHIFSYATPRPYNVERDNPCLADHEPLFVLRSVCSHWRRVTQSSSQLWSILALVPKKSEAQTLATDYVAFVRHYCLNATAISVYISDLGPLKTSMINKIIRVLLEEYAGKLRALYLDKDLGGSLLGSILKYAGRANVEFTQLAMLGFAWEGFRNPLQGTSVFSNSPCLRALALSTDESQYTPFEFPWTQITSISLSGTSPQYCFQLLPLCPNLVHCKITHLGFPGPLARAPGQCQITSMQFVRKLEWFSLGSRETQANAACMDPQFFIHFRFPAVRELIWGAPLPCNIPLPLIRDFFSAMQGIEKLELWPAVSDSPYGCLSEHLDLQVFINVTTLDVHLPDDDEDKTLGWLYRLTVRQGEETLFPHLRGLHFTVVDVGVHELIVVLHSRRNGPVYWSSSEYSADPILQPYDPNSTHWQHYSRLIEFSYEFYVSHAYEYQHETSWRFGPHHDAMKVMIEEAKEVKGFDNLYPERSRILF